MNGKSHGHMGQHQGSPAFAAPESRRQTCGTVGARVVDLLLGQSMDAGKVGTPQIRPGEVRVGEIRSGQECAS